MGVDLKGEDEQRWETCRNSVPSRKPTEATHQLETLVSAGMTASLAPPPGDRVLKARDPRRSSTRAPTAMTDDGLTIRRAPT